MVQDGDQVREVIRRETERKITWVAGGIKKKKKKKKKMKDKEKDER